MIKTQMGFELPSKAPITTFNEKLEKKIGNIVYRNISSIKTQDGFVFEVCNDKSNLVYELLKEITIYGGR